MTTATRAHYVTSIDRVGLAIGAGGALSGILGCALLAAGGRTDVGDLAIGWLVGTVFATVGIVAVGLPVWLVLHITNRRGPWQAAATGGLVALLMVSGAQTWGFGLFGAPGSDAASFGYRLISAVATGAIAAITFAGIGAAMQRIAYRRIL